MKLSSPIYKITEIPKPDVAFIKKSGTKVGDLVQIYTDTHKDRFGQDNQRFHFINHTTGFTDRATRPGIEAITTKTRCEIVSETKVPTGEDLKPKSNLDL